MTENFSFTNDERIIFTLRALYTKYGYQPYRMSKFEEYDLYSRNKDFLVSEGVIAFTDTGGRLMALKPDVTLSIIKNTRDTAPDVEKLCYDENVYRSPKGASGYEEQMQIGLEQIGGVDLCGVSEVLWLAAESLASLSGDFVLDVSHLGLASAALSPLRQGDATRTALLKCVADKNLHGIAEIARDNPLPDGMAERLCALVEASGKPADALPRIRALADELGTPEAADQLETVLSVFEDTPYADAIRIDTSVTGDMNYYNDIVFRGFLREVAEPVLSGGQYDMLMKRMHRSDRAIGFAVYLDRLERLDETRPEADADVLLLYPPKTPPKDVHRAVSALIAEGKTVFAASHGAGRLTFRERAELIDGEVITRA
ncbi:MAG: ATP phosphoribosyltransferase regulatory subunit [Clostridiales bacterium]|nr:ATP phosphoribosyltransferase regulatory subunit [Clostridiales bacterium]